MSTIGIARGLDLLDNATLSGAVDNVTMSCQNGTVTSSSIGFNRHLLNVVFVFGIIAVLINMTIIVAIVVAKKQNLWKPVYIFLANLAMADVCRGVSIISIVATTACLDTLWTKVIEIFRFFSVFYSVNSLLVLALERYWFILHVFSYESVFASRAKMTLFIVWTWLWSGASSVVAVVTGKRCVFNGRVCTLLPGPICPHFLMGIVVIIPTIAILSSSIAAVCVVWRHREFTTGDKIANSPPYVNKNTVITVVIITLVVLFSWVPQWVTFAMCNLGANPGPMSRFGMLFLAVTSAVNPMIYSIRLKKVQEAVIRLLPCNFQNKVDVW